MQRVPHGIHTNNHTYDQHFNELLVENEPLSWIAGDEFSTTHLMTQPLTITQP